MLTQIETRRYLGHFGFLIEKGRTNPYNFFSMFAQNDGTILITLSEII